MNSKLGVTNFAYGTGPYLRTTQLIASFNNSLEARGFPRLPFVIPWVYGERQREVMCEEFAEYDKKHPRELLLDKTLGMLLKSVFYGDNLYEEALKKWIATVDDVSKRAKTHLQGVFWVETLSGERMMIDGRNIVIEINRSPRIVYDIAPAYSTTFGHVAEILEHALAVSRDSIRIPAKLLKQGIKIAESVERSQHISAIAYPGTFSWMPDYVPRYGGEVLVPPITSLPQENDEYINKGIFVTITGIPGLEHIYQEARDFGLKLYSNVPDAVPGSAKNFPHIVPNKNILFQFARSGWGSIWLSMLSGTSLVVPDFDPKDDPEVYFNNKVIEELGLGVVYQGQPLADILKQTKDIQRNYSVMRGKIMKRWGTLDGNEYCAQMFADDFLSKTPDI